MRQRVCDNCGRTVSESYAGSSELRYWLRLGGRRRRRALCGWECLALEFCGLNCVAEWADAAVREDQEKGN